MKILNLRRLSLALLLSISPLILVSTVFAEATVIDYLNMFNNGAAITFGYTANDHLTIRNVSDSSIDVDSPVVKKGDENVEGYRFFATTDTGIGIPEINRCFDTVKIEGNKFSVSLDTEGMFKNTVYYLYVVPISSTVKIGQNGSCSSGEAVSWGKMSDVGSASSVNGDDPCFKISGKVFGKGNECSITSSTTTTATTSSHTTAQTSNNIASIAGVTHTYTGNQITLRWSSLGSEKMELFYEDPSNLGSFVYMGTVNTDDQVYTFTAKHDGDHLVRFAALDGSRAVHYTAHYIKTDSPQVTPVVKPVVVGPKENVLLVIFGTLILYVVYSVVKRKA